MAKREAPNITVSCKKSSRSGNPRETGPGLSTFEVENRPLWTGTGIFPRVIFFFFFFKALRNNWWKGTCFSKT